MVTNKRYDRLVRRGSLLAVTLLLGCMLHAQRASVHASVQPTEILIGEQAVINLKVITPKEKIIHFPVYEKEMIPGIEVIAMLPPDTTIENNVMTINFRYLVTSFDSTLYHIPHIPIFDGNDTILSNSFGLKVSSPQLSDSTLAYLERINKGETDSIDFNQLQLNDIKPNRRVPFVWTDWLWLLWILLGVMLLMALIGLAIYLVLRKKRRGYFFKPPEVLPAHLRAVRELDKLKQERLWLQGREKEFYSRLTDILRSYIWEREGIQAMEMTSGEILYEIGQAVDNEMVCGNLKQILTTADLVKFAKYKPYPDENDMSMVNAYLFVNQTKEDDPLPDLKQEGKKEAAAVTLND